MHRCRMPIKVASEERELCRRLLLGIAAYFAPQVIGAYNKIPRRRTVLAALIMQRSMGQEPSGLVEIASKEPSQIDDYRIQH